MVIVNNMRRIFDSFCGTGLLIGTLFLAASLTPSLIPRSAEIQGVLSGISFAAGYGIGVFLRWLWYYCDFRNLLEGRKGEIAEWAATLLCLGVTLVVLWRASEWQDTIRALMGVAPSESIRPIVVGSIGLAVAVILLMLGRVFRLLFAYGARRLDHVMPRRVANLIAFLVVGSLFWAIGSGVLASGVIRMLDGIYLQVDNFIPPKETQPLDALKSGSAASLIAWDDLGGEGRKTVLSAPDKAAIEAFTGKPALEPLRVYVGLNAAKTIRARAELALAEMRRVGAFERSIVVIATPTGTGWIDPSGQQPLEYLQHGDVATVAVQYSYLPSWLALLTEPDYGVETSRAVFKIIYEYWRNLPVETRPKLYLNGLSLGALNSGISFDLFDIVGDPFQGAFWIGPPFPSRIWNEVTDARDPETPSWLPRFRDGSLVRFTNQQDHTQDATANWGPMRIVYLQYPSDPIVFFKPQYGWRKPDWMYEPRGADVSPALRWFPLVTVLQLGLDVMTATTTPFGHGHVYAPEHYIDGWVAVIEPQGWSDADIQRLKDKLAIEIRQQDDRD